MRAIRVLGLVDGGREVVCEESTGGERFLLARDDRLRAAVRGDLDRYPVKGGEPTLRPREIQARIRAGASLPAVAEAAGTSIARVEGFAYPVLLERATQAERARRARPTVDGISSGTAVEDIVKVNLAARGHEGALAWDAYRDDDTWVLVLSWQAGRSENRAHWTFHPGPAGGTLTARDEAAADVVDPALRVLRPVPRAQAVASRDLLDPTVPTSPVPAGPLSPSHPQSQAQREVEDTVIDERAGARVEEPARIVRTGTDSASAGPRAGSSSASRTAPPVQPTVPPMVAPKARASMPMPPDPRSAPATSSRSSRKNTRPAMPSWEDVLLGGSKPQK